MPAIVRQIVESEAMARELRGHRPRRFRKPRLQRQPDGVIRGYRGDLRGVLEQTKAAVDALLVARLPELERLAATRVDAERQDVDGLLAALRAIFRQIRDAIIGERERETLAETVARDTAGFNLTQVRRQFRGVLGVDVFFAEPRLQGLLADFAEANARLITSLPEQYIQQVEDLTRRGLRAGRRAADISAEIQGRFGVAQSRADLIARDQIGKLNANLTRDRQQSLGIEQYVWRTSRDERVRESHRALEGTIHSWDDPPSVNGRLVHPGEDVRCRCTAEPLIPGAPLPPRTTPADVPRDPDLVAQARNRRRRSQRRVSGR